MTTGKRKSPAMPAAQHVSAKHNEAPFSLENFEGASFRLSHSSGKAESRSPAKEEARESKPSRLPVIDHQKELVKLLNGYSGRHSHWQVFSDFCEIGAITFSNAVDLNQREKREERYLQIIKGYSREELDKFAQGFAHLTMALETRFGDVLGRTFHDLELHNKWAGQFFTPYDVSRMMAKMTIGNGEDLSAKIAARGFVTTQEPAVGSGAMVIALAQEMRDAGVNYQKHLHVTAIDVDAKCVHMAYLQFALLHIPAIIIHGNTLSLETYGHWYTPAHLMGLWNWKLRARGNDEEAHEIEAPPKIEAVKIEAPAKEPADGPHGQLKLF